MKILLSTIIVGMGVLISGASSALGTAYDVLEVNGHPGYLTAYEISPDGVLDNIIMVVTGFDTSNNSHPIDDINNQFQDVVSQLSPLGWDFIVFDYVRGDIDIKQNAENLAHFITLLDIVSVPDYHLAVVGGSMGGIVTRTMFVQEDSNMGVDTFVSLDSPHHGVYLSPWIEDLADVVMGAVAGHQMANGDPQYIEHYGWLESVENSPGWMATHIDPMATLAIALSNGEGLWVTDLWDLILNTPYHPISSFVTVADPITTDFMPYHSVCKFDNVTYNEFPWIFDIYRWYNDTSTSYFDHKRPNPRTEHGAPEFSVYQALGFILINAP